MLDSAWPQLFNDVSNLSLWYFLLLTLDFAWKFFFFCESHALYIFENIEFIMNTYVLLEDGDVAMSTWHGTHACCRVFTCFLGRFYRGWSEVKTRGCSLIEEEFSRGWETSGRRGRSPARGIGWVRRVEGWGCCPARTCWSCPGAPSRWKRPSVRKHWT